MDEFHSMLKDFFGGLGPAKKMVLATALENRVTARMMSVIILDNTFYFQTDKNLMKYGQLAVNPKVALCIDNIQVEGIASIQGHPLEKQNRLFAEAFKANFPNSFELYTARPGEVMVKVVPVKITLWKYEGKKPYREFFDINEKSYKKEYYV